MRKKITIFSLHLSFGGIERYISTFCKMFSSDYDIEIISTFKYDEKPAFDFDQSIKIKYLVNDYPDKVSLKLLVKQHKFISVLKELYRRKKIAYRAYCSNIKEIKNINTDIILSVRTYHSRLISKYLKNKNILTIATEHNYHNNDKKIIKNVVKSVKNFNYFVLCTDELYNFYKNKVSSKCVMINNSIDKKSIEKSKLASSNIISVCRFSPEKGLMDLIDVFKYLSLKNNDIQLNLIGDGYQRKEIEEKINDLKLSDRIHLTGFLSGSELKEKYLDSSLYILTSYTEAFGLVLIEAMNYGVPCIAFDDASGARALLKDDIGVLIKKRDKELMADKIIDLFENRKKLIGYSERINLFINNFYPENIKKEWEKILK